MSDAYDRTLAHLEDDERRAWEHDVLACLRRAVELLERAIHERAAGAP